MIAKVASPRKRGSPPAASDCPGSQNLGVALDGQALQSAQRIGAAFRRDRLLDHVGGIALGESGLQRAVASSRAAIDKACFMGAPPLFCRAIVRFVAVALQGIRLPTRRAKQLQLQEPRRVAAHDLVPLGRRHPDPIHHLEACALERDQRRRIGPEHELVGPDGAQAHGGGERGVARRFEIIILR